MNTRKVLGLFALLFCIACTDKPIKTVKVNISFDKAKSEKISKQSLNNDDPYDDEWEVPTPSSVSEINCIGIMINDNSGDAGKCLLEDGSEITATKFSDFFGSDGTHSVVLNVTDGVEFNVVALKSTTGKCPSAKDLDDFKSTISQPLHIGKETIDITPSSTEIVLTTNYSKRKGIEDCRGIPGIPDDEDDRGGDGDGPQRDPRCDNSLNAAGYPAGDGTAASPYLICHISQLETINNNLNAHYELGDRIDGFEYPFEPIGPFVKNTMAIEPFTGSLNGRGYTIYDLTIQQDSSDLALFKYTQGALIENLHFENVIINAGNASSGYHYAAVAAFASDTTFKNISFNADISAVQLAGGLIGALQDSNTSTSGTIIENINFSTTINALQDTATYYGGLIGKINLSSAPVSVQIDEVGGYVNINSNPATATDTPAGGLIGAIEIDSNTGVSISNTNIHGYINGVNDVGGFIGKTSLMSGSGTVSISASYNQSTVQGGGSNIGGMIGMIDNAILNIDNSFTSGDVIGPAADTTGFIFGFGGATSTLNKQNLYYHNPAARGYACQGSTSGLTITCTEEDVFSDFYSSSHPVYTSAPYEWDFTNIWYMPGGVLPELQFTKGDF